jgi:hypothetical protein
MGQGNLAVVPVRVSPPKATIFNRFFPEARAGTGFRAVFAPETSQRRSGVFRYSGQAAAGKVGGRADCHVLRSRKEPRAGPGEPSGTVAPAWRSWTQPSRGPGTRRRVNPADHARPLPCTVTYPDSGHLRPPVRTPPATSSWDRPAFPRRAAPLEDVSCQLVPSQPLCQYMFIIYNGSEGVFDGSGEA